MGFNAMKIVMMTTLMALLAVGARAAGVNDFGAMVQRHTPACRLSLPRIDRTAAVACCDGVAACGRMLATTKVDRPRAPFHT